MPGNRVELAVYRMIIVLTIFFLSGMPAFRFQVDNWNCSIQAICFISPIGFLNT